MIELHIAGLPHDADDVRPACPAISLLPKLAGFFNLDDKLVSFQNHPDKHMIFLCFGSHRLALGL